MAYRARLSGKTFVFQDIKEVLAKAGEEKTGDNMAGIAARDATERAAAKCALADMTLEALYENPVVPYERDEVTRVMIDGISRAEFGRIRRMTVGELRELMLKADGDEIGRLGGALTAEMAAAVAKLMGNLDLVYAAAKIPVTARCNTTIGLPGTLSVRLQPNHPADGVAGIVASACEGLSYACGDAVIGVNPSTDDPGTVRAILEALNELVTQYRVPTQNCVLAHVTTQMAALNMGAPMDLMFQSIAGSEAANRAFGINVALLDAACAQMREQKRHSAGENFMYFETGQGSALSSDAHNGADQTTMEARCYALARRYNPFLVNTVVGFMGPEFLYDGRQICRAGLEDHFMGKLLGVPMGADVCYTNHARADQNDVDTLALLLGAAGCNFIMGVPATDDIMLMYQSTAFHDGAALRELLGKRPIAPFERRMEELGVLKDGRLGERAGDASVFGLTPEAAARATSARVFVGRAGARLRTNTAMRLRADHAVAMDAVWDDGDCPAVDALGFLRVQTLVGGKEEYIRRPDRARRFSPEVIEAVRRGVRSAPDVQVLAADGLSAAAIEANIAEMYPLIKARCEAAGYAFGDPIFIKYGRVAAMDKIAEAVGARVTLLFVGERPGLGTRESMSCYMAYESSPAKPESQRNVVSNIYKAGMPVAAAADMIMALIARMMEHRISGVALNSRIRGADGGAERAGYPGERSCAANTLA